MTTPGRSTAGQAFLPALVLGVGLASVLAMAVGAFAKGSPSVQGLALLILLGAIAGLAIWGANGAAAIGGRTPMVVAAMGAVIGAAFAGAVGWATGFPSWMLPLYFGSAALGSVSGARLAPPKDRNSASVEEA